MSSKGLIRISVPNARYVKDYLNQDINPEYFFAKGKRYSLNSIEPLQHINSFNYDSLICMASLFGLKEYKNSRNYYNDNIGQLTFVNVLKNYFKRYIPINRKATTLIFGKK